MASFAQNIDRIRATQTDFTVAMEFSGEGGGVWTLNVAGGTCRVREGRAAYADLVIVQSPETFVKTRTGIQNTMLAILTRQIQVRGWQNLGVFGKLFPIKSLDFAPATKGTLEVSMMPLAVLPVQASAA